MEAIREASRLEVGEPSEGAPGFIINQPTTKTRRMVFHRQGSHIVWSRDKAEEFGSGVIRI